MLTQLKVRGALCFSEVSAVISNFACKLPVAEVCDLLGARVVMRSCAAGAELVLAEEDQIAQRMSGGNPAPLATFTQRERLLIREFSSRLNVQIGHNRLVTAVRRASVKATLAAAAPRGKCAYALSELYPAANAELRHLLQTKQAFVVNSTVWAAPMHARDTGAQSKWMSLTANAR